jgi:hypothetical protein
MSRSLSLRIVDFDCNGDVGAEASKPVHAILAAPRASMRQSTMSASTVSCNVAATGSRPRTNHRARRSVVASRRCGPSISSFAANTPAGSIVGADVLEAEPAAGQRVSSLADGLFPLNTVRANLPFSRRAETATISQEGYSTPTPRTRAIITCRACPLATILPSQNFLVT